MTVNMDNLPDPVYTVTLHRRGQGWFSLAWIDDDPLPAYESKDYQSPESAAVVALSFISRVDLAREGKRHGG